MLRIKDLSFDVDDATIEATLADGELLWSINVQASEKTIQGHVWQPRAYVDLFRAGCRSAAEMIEKGWRIPSARALGGGTILPGQANCCLYVFEHDFLEDSRLTFDVLDDQLSLTWTGLCSVNWNSKYGKDLDFRVQTPIEFLGFSVPATTEREARRLMKPQFDLAGMEYHRERGGGDSYFLPVPGSWPPA